MFLLKQRVKNNNCERSELFVSLGCQAVRSYPEIILEHNDKLSNQIKQDLTCLINNLQLCSQLEDRISKLEIDIKEVNNKLDKAINNTEKKGLKDKRNECSRSIRLKKEKIKKFNQENEDLLVKIGQQFYQNKLLAEQGEFARIYQLLNLCQ